LSKSKKEDNIDDLVGTYKGSATRIWIENRTNFNGGGNTIDTTRNSNDTTSFTIEKTGQNSMIIPSEYSGPKETAYSGNDYYLNRGEGGQNLKFSPDINKVEIYDSVFRWYYDGQGNAPDLVKLQMVTRFVGYK
jgi:hypothetical protein